MRDFQPKTSTRSMQKRGASDVAMVAVTGALYSSDSRHDLWLPESLMHAKVHSRDYMTLGQSAVLTL